MKKLMIIATAALMVGIANAASIQWGTGTMYKPDTANDGEFSTTKAKATVTAYLFQLTEAQYTALTTTDSVADSYATVAEKVFKAYATVDGNSFSIADGLATASGKTGSTNSYKNFTDSREFAKNDTAYAAMILKYTDAEKGDYYIANVGAYTFVEDVDGELKGFGTSEFADPANTALTGWTAVPEPTSGLLVLLGMAGLALRRKRA